MDTVAEYIPQHAADNVKSRETRPRYSAKTTLEVYIRIRERIIANRKAAVPGRHRADAS